MKVSIFAVAAALTLAAGSCVQADEPETQSQENASVAVLTPIVKLGDVAFYRSYEDAFPKAKKEGKLVLLYRMLGDLDGLT